MFLLYPCSNINKLLLLPCLLPLPCLPMLPSSFASAASSSNFPCTVLKLLLLPHRLIHLLLLSLPHLLLLQAFYLIFDYLTILLFVFEIGLFCALTDYLRYHEETCKKCQIVIRVVMSNPSCTSNAPC